MRSGSTSKVSMKSTTGTGAEQMHRMSMDDSIALVERSSFPTLTTMMLRYHSRDEEADELSKLAVRVAADRIPLEEYVHVSRTDGYGWRVKWTSPPNKDRVWYRTEYRWFSTWGAATAFARRLRRRLLLHG